MSFIVNTAPMWPTLDNSIPGKQDSQLAVHNTCLRAWLIVNANRCTPCLDTACPTPIAASEHVAGNAAAVATYHTDNAALFYIIISSLPANLQANFNIAPFLNNGYLTWQRLLDDTLGDQDARHLRALDVVFSIDPSAATTVAELQTVHTRLQVALTLLETVGNKIAPHSAYLIFLRNCCLHDKHFEMNWKSHTATTAGDAVLPKLQLHYQRFRTASDGLLTVVRKPKISANLAFASSGAPRPRPPAVNPAELPWRCPACKSTKHALPTECSIINPTCSTCQRSHCDSVCWVLYPQLRADFKVRRAARPAPSANNVSLVPPREHSFDLSHLTPSS